VKGSKYFKTLSFRELVVGVNQQGFKGNSALEWSAMSTTGVHVRYRG